LTMRTFHIGGTASRISEANAHEARLARHGQVRQPQHRCSTAKARSWR
jgi:hypothetical protein